MTNMMTRSMDFILLKARLLKSHRNRNKSLPIFDNFSFLRSRKTVRHIRKSKVFFIMRGLPGSGKSTLVRAIKSRFKEAIVCSADSFFVQKDGSYAYDFEQLPQAHEECADLAQKAAEMGVQHIVVDNTNILRWEMGKYFKLAREYGYAVIVVEPKTPWKLEPVELAEKNTHGCSVEVVEQKMKKFKAVLPMYWGWFFDETVASELLTLGETCFDLCMRTVPEFASYMNELGVSKGLTLPLSFKEFYNRPKGNLLHCTAFFSGMKNHRTPGTDEYADRPEVERSMGKAFSMKLVGIMFSPRTAGIRVILNNHQLSLWGAEDVWFLQPPPKPKTEDAVQSTDSSEVLTQDAPKVPKQKKDRIRRSDISKVPKTDESDTKSGGAGFTDALDISLSDVSFDLLVDMAPDQSGTESAQDPSDISAQDQGDYKMSPYPGAIETASYQNDIKIEPDQSGTTLLPGQSGSEGSNGQEYSEIALGGNGAKMALDKSGTTVTVAARSAKVIPETCCVVVGDDRTEDSAEEILDLEVGGSFPCVSCLESKSSQKHQSDISADKFFPSVEDVDIPASEFNQIPSTCQEELLSDISAENVCQVPLINEENKSNIPADKFTILPTDSASLQDHQELIPKKINEVHLADFLLKDVESEDARKFSQSNISTHQPLENDTSILPENSINLSASDIYPEPTQSKDSSPVEGNLDEVPRIQLKQGSRAHITLGCAGYGAVQTGFDQMELLLCEDSGMMVGESVVTDDVEITYYGEGRCTVYFDWPIYKSALFTGEY